MEDDFVDLIGAKADEGEWFPFKGAAEFQIKRVPQPRRRGLMRQYIGKKVESANEIEKSFAYRLALASEALLDSRKVRILPRYLDGLEIANGAEGPVVLDGKWSPEVKRAVLSEVPGVLNFVIETLDGMSAKADEEESGKG